MPRFVLKHIKETSITKVLARADRPDTPFQDGPRLPLFCGDCEQVLSRDERLFATRVFHPRHRQPKPSPVDYGIWLLRFAVGLGFRTALHALEEPPDPEVSVDEAFAGSFEQGTKRLESDAIPAWRRFLLEQSSNPGGFVFHFLQTDYLSSGSPPPPPELQAYLMRAADMTMTLTRERRSALLIVMPGFLFWVPIVPRNETGWLNTRIRKKGRFDPSTDVTICAPGFLDYLVDRAVGLRQRITAQSESARAAKVQRIERNADRIPESESLRATLEADALLRRATE